AGRTTKVGFLLDSALDRLADAAFPAALAIAAARTSSAADGTLAALAVGATAACWFLEYVRARANLAAPEERGHQVITPGERPTRIILTAVGLALPALAFVALWGHVAIVGASALFLLAHSTVRLHRLDHGD
ncbi:MAG: hypothetical protein ACRD12_24695, partial [Acidimicrobiales bacterium]